MKIAMAGDHAGFAMKAALKKRGEKQNPRGGGQNQEKKPP